MPDFGLSEFSAYFQQFEKGNILLFYNGPMSHDVLFNMAEEIKDLIHGSETKKHKVLAVFVELAENIKHYASERTAGDDPHNNPGIGIVTLYETPRAFMVGAGNKVELARGRELEARCRHISSLDREALNQLYNEQRNVSVLSGAPGGNIGLIEVARRSRNPLQVSLKLLGQDQAFFSIEVTINKEP